MAQDFDQDFSGNYSESIEGAGYGGTDDNGLVPEGYGNGMDSPVNSGMETAGNGDSGSAGNGAGTKKKSFFWRSSGSWTDMFVIASILAFLLAVMGMTVSTILMKNFIPVTEWFNTLTGDEDVTAFLIQYFSFFGIWIVFMIVISVFKENWPMWKAFLYNGHGNNLRAIGIGILLGAGMNGFCVLMSALMGDIALSFNEFNPKLFFLFLFCVMIQSGAEEIANRCYLYQKLRRRYRWPVIAIVVNALVFMSMHLANDGLTVWGLVQLFEIGVLFSLIIYFFDSLWTVIWAHTAWNFSQSIVFGLPNSGIVSKYSVFRLDAASARNGLFYNTGFGVEGSVGACVVIGVVLLAILIIGIARKGAERKDYWKEKDEMGKVSGHRWEPVLLAILIIAIFLFFVYSAFMGNNNTLFQEMQNNTGQTAQVQTDADRSAAESGLKEDQKTAEMKDADQSKPGTASQKETDKTEAGSGSKKEEDRTEAGSGSKKEADGAEAGSGSKKEADGTEAASTSQKETDKADAA